MFKAEPQIHAKVCVRLCYLACGFRSEDRNSVGSVCRRMNSSTATAFLYELENKKQHSWAKKPSI